MKCVLKCESKCVFLVLAMHLVWPWYDPSPLIFRYSIKYMYLSLSIYLCIIDTHWPCTWHELGNVECLDYGKDRELFWRNCVNLSEKFSFCHRQQKFGWETEIEQVRGPTQKSRHKWCKTGNQWRHLHQKFYKPSENIPPLAAHISSRLSHIWRAHWYMHRSRYSIELCNDVRFLRGPGHW